MPDDGVTGARSSGRGSIARNTAGTREIYRGSKAALNMLMRSFAARQPESSPAMLLLAPSWIRTDPGGTDGPFSIEETIPVLVSLVLAEQGTPGLRYPDRFGVAVRW